MLGIPDALFGKGNFLNIRSRSCPPETLKSKNGQVKNVQMALRKQPNHGRAARLQHGKTSARNPSRSATVPAPTLLQSPDVLWSRTMHRRTEAPSLRPRPPISQKTDNRRAWRNTRVEIAASLPPTFSEYPPSYSDIIKSPNHYEPRVSRSVVMNPRTDELFLEPSIGQPPRHRHRRTIQVYKGHEPFLESQSVAFTGSVIETVPEATPIDSSNLYGWGAWPGNINNPTAGSSERRARFNHHT